MASVPVNVSASVPVKVSSHRKLTGYTASASVSVKASVSGSFPLIASASVPLRAPPADLVKVSDSKRLKNFISDYAHIHYAGPDDLQRYDRMDFGFYRRSWTGNASWSLVFVPGVTQDNWRDYLLPAESNFMDTGDLLNVVASGSSNGLLFSVSKVGFLNRAAHGVRTVIPLKELKNDSRVNAGGSLLLNICLLEMNDDGEGHADPGYALDGYLYWNLYLN